jgi:hypothetical protein
MTSPSDQGYKAWSLDPAVDTSGGTALADGVIHVVGMNLKFPARVSTISAVVHTAGATIANCFAGLYNLAGTRLGVTADQATPWASTGLKAMALTAPVDVPAGWLYVALLEGSGTTDVQFARGAPALSASPAVANAGMTAPKLRSGTIGSGLTALPATIDTASLVVTGSAVYFVAVG